LTKCRENGIFSNPSGEPPQANKRIQKKKGAKKRKTTFKNPIVRQLAN